MGSRSKRLIIAASVLDRGLLFLGAVFDHLDEPRRHLAEAHRLEVLGELLLALGQRCGLVDDAERTAAGTDNLKRK